MKTHILLSPITGRVIPLETVPDDAFATGMLGIGLAIEPDVNGDGRGESRGESRIYAPADGVVESVADARHAYTLTTPAGIDLLVHIGVDTVALGGSPFTALVAPGDRVHAGDPLAKVDLRAIRDAGLSTVTPIILSGNAANLTPVFCDARGGETTVATYEA